MPKKNADNGFVGACRYCGQIVDIGKKFDSQAAADEYATLNCQCSDAKRHKEIEKQKEIGLQHVNSLFAEGCENLCGLPAVDGKVVDLLGRCVIAVVNERIGSVTIVLAGDGKAKVSMSSKGNIRVSRSQGRSITLEGGAQ